MPGPRRSAGSTHGLAASAGKRARTISQACQAVNAPGTDQAPSSVTRAAAGPWGAPGRGGARGTAPTGAGQCSASAHQATVRRCSGSSLRIWVSGRRSRAGGSGSGVGTERQCHPAVSGDLAVQRDGRRLPAAGLHQRRHPVLGELRRGRAEFQGRLHQAAPLRLVALGRAPTGARRAPGEGTASPAAGAATHIHRSILPLSPTIRSPPLWSPLPSARTAPSGAGAAIAEVGGVGTAGEERYRRYP